MKKILTTAILALSINAFAQQWTTKASMPTPREAASVAVVNNIIYVIGGSDASLKIIKTVEAYDPSTDKWTTKASMSVARGELVVAAVNGKIYAIGGYNGTSAINTVEEYDPSTDTWKTKSPMPTTRSVISGGVINNKIYVVGGWPGGMSTLEEYDPSTDTWKTQTPCSVGRKQINSCAVLNNLLFFIGGENSSNTIFYQINEAYNPTSNTWMPKANFPQAIFSGAATVLNNEIHYFGGTVNPNGVPYTPNFNYHYIYNSSTNTWSDNLSMLNKRSRHVAASVNNKIYVIGGFDSTGVHVGLNEEYSVCSSTIYDTIHITVTDTLKIKVNITGINPPNNIANLNIYPNPTNDHITINYGNYSLLSGYTLKITNSLGQTVFTTVINQQQSYVDLSTWSGKGIYFVQLIDGNQNTIENKKIVLQ